MPQKANNDNVDSKINESETSLNIEGASAQGSTIKDLNGGTNVNPKKDLSTAFVTGPTANSAGNRSNSKVVIDKSKSNLNKSINSFSTALNSAGPNRSCTRCGSCRPS